MCDHELIATLRGVAVETGSLLCLGCGYERNCSTHGCNILRRAAERLEELAPPPNEPLTLEELREMDREPVWIERIGDISHKDSAWAFVNVERSICRTTDGSPAYFDFYGRGWLAYRRRPEEGKDEL